MNNLITLSIAVMSISLVLFTGATFIYKKSESKINYIASPAERASSDSQKNLLQQTLENLPMPEAVHHNVPFATQAPFENWKDKRQATGTTVVRKDQEAGLSLVQSRGPQSIRLSKMDRRGRQRH